LLKVVEP